MTNHNRAEELTELVQKQNLDHSPSDAEMIALAQVHATLAVADAIMDTVEYLARMSED